MVRRKRAPQGSLLTVRRALLGLAFAVLNVRPVTPLKTMENADLFTVLDSSFRQLVD